MTEQLFPHGTTDTYAVNVVADKIRRTPLFGRETYNLSDLEERIENKAFETDEQLAFLMWIALNGLIWDRHGDIGTLGGFELNQGQIVATIGKPSDPNTEY